MRSSSSLGVVFIALGGLSISGIGQRPVGVVPWLLAGLLVTAGVLLLTRRRAAVWLAMAAGLVTALSGIMPYLHHPELALPIPPPLSIGIGLYLVFRTALSASGVGTSKRRGFIPPATGEAPPSG